MIAPVRWALNYILTTNTAKVRNLDINIIDEDRCLILYYIISYLIFLYNIVHPISGPVNNSFENRERRNSKNERFDYNNTVHVPVEVIVSRQDFFFSISFYFCDHPTTFCSFTKTLYPPCAMCVFISRWEQGHRRSPIRFWNGFEITSSICGRHHSWLLRHKRFWIQIYKIFTLSSQINNYLPSLFSSELVTLTIMQILALPSSRLFQIIFFFCRSLLIIVAAE